MDVLLLSLALAVHAPLQFWALIAGPLPGLNEGLPLWPNLLAYGLAAPWVGYLLWMRKPRARMAAYVFLTFDILRALRRLHWLPLALDIAILAYLQTPAMRALYPSMWSRRKHLLARAPRV